MKLLMDFHFILISLYTVQSWVAAWIPFYHRTSRKYNNHILIGKLSLPTSISPSFQRERCRNLFYQWSDVDADFKPSILVNRTDRQAPIDKTNTSPHIVNCVEQLQHAVLDCGIQLKDIVFNSTVVRSTSPSSNIVRSAISNSSTSGDHGVLQHPVLQLIHRRIETKSLPGAREFNDTAILALSIEGGGMRGAVSAGMAAAISCLGLADAFDSVYGSSAGSVIGAYMISRQMCVDVYTDVLTTAKTTFVSKRRILAWIGSSLVDKIVNTIVDSIRGSILNDHFDNGFVKTASNVDPGMNISFVLDGIMCPKSGLRPLDVESFRHNDLRQHLRIVASTKSNGKLKSACFGSKEMDFFDLIEDGITVSATKSTESKITRHGLFACLEASMNVPAATGPPVQLRRFGDANAITAFDAFCFEPIPYRSAVEEGATHVLVLKTRPESSPIGTQPGFYETNVAPLYFNAHNMSDISAFFEKGGQQYLYVEDYLTLEEGKNAYDNHDGVRVPPPMLLYGVDNLDGESKNSFIKDRNENWKRAHLLPVALPVGTTELPTLSVDKDEVLHAVRQGFAAAFDMLSSVAGVTVETNLNGQRIAELVFPDRTTDNNILEAPMFISGQTIQSTVEKTVSSPHETMAPHRSRIPHDINVLPQPLPTATTEKSPSALSCPKRDAEILLRTLPGFESGALISLARGLHYWNSGK